MQAGAIRVQSETGYSKGLNNRGVTNKPWGWGLNKPWGGVLISRGVYPKSRGAARAEEEAWVLMGVVRNHVFFLFEKRAILNHPISNLVVTPALILH